MKPADKDAVMEKFIAGDLDILVATTVIEVGVNVPAATIMVIEHSERFGLAQLHQLRGRVGRGADQSYCFLLYSGPLERRRRRGFRRCGRQRTALSSRRRIYICAGPVTFWG
jgi:RecG-like helicase